MKIYFEKNTENLKVYFKKVVYCRKSIFNDTMSCVAIACCVHNRGRNKINRRLYRLNSSLSSIVLGASFPYGLTRRPDRPQDHDPHPADQGLHFEQIHGFCPSRRPGWAYRREAPRKEGSSPNSKPELSFHAIGNKNAGNAQQNARRERLFFRRSALHIFVRY